MDASNSQRIQCLNTRLYHLLQMQYRVHQARNGFHLAQNDFWILSAKQSPRDK